MQSEFDIAVRGLRDRMLKIRSIDSLASINDEALTVLAEYSRERHFSQGETILRYGEPLDRVYLVLGGSVEVRRGDQLVAHVRRGRGVGMLSLLARDERGVDAIAESDVHALEIPASVFIAAYEENFSLVRNSLRLSTEGLLKKRGCLPIEPGADHEPQMGEYRDRELTLVERIIKVRQGELFRRINLDAVVDMCRRMKEVRLEPGDVIWEIGERATFSLRVDYGLCRCTAPDGKSVLIGTDWVIGALDALGDHPRAYQVTAETEVIAVKMEGFMSVLETNPQLALDLIAMFANLLLEGN